MGESAYNNSYHSHSAFLSGDITSQYKYQNGDGYSGNRQRKFNVFLVHDDDDELDGEAKEKEEVKFKQGNVDLDP